MRHCRTAGKLGGQAVGEPSRRLAIRICMRSGRRAAKPSGNARDADRQGHSSATESTGHQATRCGVSGDVVRSDEPDQERAAMSCVLEPRHCGEVALQERAVIRGSEPYHLGGRMGHESPVNAGPPSGVDLQPRSRVPRSARTDTPSSPPRAPSPGASPAGHPRPSRRSSPGYGSGYLPKSPSQKRPYSGLARTKALQTRLFRRA